MSIANNLSSIKSSLPPHITFVAVSKGRRVSPLLILFYLLFPSMCIAQSYVNHKLTIQQIDSVVKISRPRIQASGALEKRQFLWIKNCGGFHYTTYVDKDNPHQLIKGLYYINQILSKKHEEDIFAEFYYNDNLFYIRIKKTIYNDKADPVTITFDIDYTKEIDNYIDEALGFDVKKWIDQRNKTLLEYSKLNENH